MPKIKQEIIELSQKTEEPSFWNDRQNAESIIKQLNEKKELVNSIELKPSVTKIIVKGDKEVPSVADTSYWAWPTEKPYTITKEGNLWVVRGKEIEKLFSMTKFEEEEGALRFARKLRGMGVEEELSKMGAKPGDAVVINDYLFTFKG